MSEGLWRALVMICLVCLEAWSRCFLCLFMGLRIDHMCQWEGMLFSSVATYLLIDVFHVCSIPEERSLVTAPYGVAPPHELMCAQETRKAVSWRFTITRTALQ
eukprot:232971-Amphidinium_carterae.2